MKINAVKEYVKEEYKNIYGKPYISEVIAYRIKDVQPCCERITNNPLIDVTYSCVDDDLYSDDGMEYAVTIHNEVRYPDGEGDYFIDNEYYKIDYCPYCAEKIEVNIIDEVDLTEDYIRLKSERDDLNEKRRNCDSKKETREMDIKIATLDVLIEGFHHSDGLETRNDDEDDDYE